MHNEDYTILSKLSEKPMTNGKILAYGGNSWNINDINNDLYSLDTDVYASVKFDDKLDELFFILVKDAKLSLWYDIQTKAWFASNCNTSIQEQFNNWINEIHIANSN